MQSTSAGAKNEIRKGKKKSSKKAAVASVTPVVSSPAPTPPPRSPSMEPARLLPDVEDDDPFRSSMAAFSAPYRSQTVDEMFDDEPLPPSATTDSRRHRADSGDYRHQSSLGGVPALAASVARTTSAPAPPEWTPAWPSQGEFSLGPSTTAASPPPSSSTRQPRAQQLAPQPEPMYAIRSASDVSVDSEGRAVVNQAAMGDSELAVPRRMMSAGRGGDTLGLDSLHLGTMDASDVYGKATLMPSVTSPGRRHGPASPELARSRERNAEPGVGAVPFGRAQSGVYIHSLPSASEAEVHSSPSDSDEVGEARHLARPIDPPGHVARPVSTPSTSRSTSTFEGMSHRIRRSTGASSRTPRPSQQQDPHPSTLPSTSRGTHDMSSPPILTALPEGVASSSSERDMVLWTKWDALDGRRLLILGYQSGSVQVWDVTELDEVYEVLHLSGAFKRSTMPISAAILPLPPVLPARTDAFARVRPILVVLLNTAELFVYSLQSHAVVKQVAAAPASVERPIKSCDLQVSDSFIVVTTISAINDVSVHILSAYDVNHLLTIPLSPNSQLPPVSLSRRLLALPLPPMSDPGSRHRRTPTLQAGIAVLKDGASRAGNIQTEVATTARGIWGGISSAATNAWGGFVGGTPASTSSSASSSSGRWAFSRSAPTPTVLGDLPPASISPSPARHGDDRRLSAQASLASFRGIPGSNLLKWSPSNDMGDSELPEPAKPQWIALYDLDSLLDSPQRLSVRDGPGAPYLLAHFPFNVSSSTHQSSSPITNPTIIGSVPTLACLSISPSGSLLAAADGEGTAIRVFHVRSMGSFSRRETHTVSRASSPRAARPPSLSSSPSDPYVNSPRLRRRSSVSSAGGRPSTASESDTSVNAPAVFGSGGGGSRPKSSGGKNVWHIYDLVRGMTKAKVESIVWSYDERWVGVGTASGTLHLFATNPYGGPPDEDSHLDGRVRNIKEWPRLRTTVQALAKVHTKAAPPPSPDGMPVRRPVPLFTFTFPPVSTSLRSRLFDPRKTSSPTAPSFATSRKLATALQDVIVTLPSSGKLELHRNTVIPPVKAPDAPPTSSKTPPRASPGKTSISLPTSGLTHMMQAVRGTSAPGLRGHMASLASWDVNKAREWEDVKGEFRHEGNASSRRSYEQDWLSEAELSTFTTSAAMLPKSIYLSHQFSFHSFTDDWQAPLHRGILDLPSTKLQVRPEVEANLVLSSGMSGFRHGQRTGETEAFVQDDPITGSPFDEHMSTAIHANMEPMVPIGTTPILPSYPNGLQPHAGSWRDATTPLKHAAVGLSEGVGGGIRHLQRGLGKVAKGGSGKGKRDSESLVFDERDVVHDSGSASQPPGSEHNSTSSALIDSQEDWRHGDVDKDVAEYEAYETFGLGVVGEMDEDHASSSHRSTSATPATPPSRVHPRQAPLPPPPDELEPEDVPPSPPAKPLSVKRKKRVTRHDESL